ncbi:glycerophosphodiester phosphodiesterase [Halobium salinum]|uniref:Glycerophosphodiester phosphodiesterase n=1 Tax=Halobium salinum TaxID=1364940 RepID=A0ABD5P8B5_9EURY|nr:glycerophosphodiester phosphodiesterase family protein [Halobium salinum]
MEITAHRGFEEAYPENTVEAASRAAADADRVEVDVRRCGSGELVATHFDRVGFTTDGSGRVGELSVDELAALSVGGSGEGVPLVADIAAAVPDDTPLRLDLKGPALGEDVVDLARAVDNDVLLSSFYADALWEARDIDDEIPLSYLFDVRADRNMTTARLLDCEYVSPHWSLALGTDVVERAHAAGMKVEAWTVATSAMARLLDSAGVDSVAASSPELAPDEVRGLDYVGALAEPGATLERLRALMH